MHKVSIMLATVLTSTLMPAISQAEDPPETISRDSVHHIVWNYLNNRASLITGEKSKLNNLQNIPMTKQLQSNLESDYKILEVVREFSRKTPSRGYDKAEVAVTIDHVKKDTERSVTVTATERTRLYFDHEDPKAPSFEAYRLKHEFRIVAKDGKWLLEHADADLKPGPPPPTQITRIPRSTIVETYHPKNNSSKTTQIDSSIEPNEKTPSKLSPINASDPPYDYLAMLDYANKYWDNYNPEYRAFDNDCTNFISQIMDAGGWDHKSGLWSSNSAWWYNWLNNTHSWSGADNWFRFAREESGRVTSLEHIYQMQPSDVLQVDWDLPGNENPNEPPDNIDHTMIVTGTKGEVGHATEVYVTYHSNDRLNVPFWGSLLPGANPKSVWYASRT